MKHKFVDLFGNDALLKYNDDFNKRWIKEPIINMACLFEENDRLNTDDFLEADLLHNLWQFIDKAFRTSGVKAKLGERTSASFALGRNEGRSLELAERRERKSVGAKVDILFKKKITDEVGCAEVGKYDVLIVDDKYLDNGMIKLPKTLRDMLCTFAEVNRQKINQLYTIGFLLKASVILWF